MAASGGGVDACDVDGTNVVAEVPGTVLDAVLGLVFTINWSPFNNGRSVVILTIVINP